MICYYFYQKKKNSIMTPFLCKLGPKKQFLPRGFTSFFSEPENCSISKHTLLILMVSSNIFYWKSVKESKVGVIFVGKIWTKLGQL